MYSPESLSESRYNYSHFVTETILSFSLGMHVFGRLEVHPYGFMIVYSAYADSLQNRT